MTPLHRPSRWLPRRGSRSPLLPLLIAQSALWLGPCLQAQVPAPPTEALLARWRFDEGGGTSVADATGRHPGTLFGSGATLTATGSGIAGGALHMNPNGGGGVTMGDVLPMVNASFSVSVWFRTPPGDLTPEAVLFSKHQPWIENGYWVLLNGSGGTIAGYAGVGGFAVSQVPVNDGQWHHAVLTYSTNGQGQLYVDGGAPAATAVGGQILPNASSFLIGAMDPPPPERRFSGWIDEVQVYNFVLSPSEVEFLHTHPALSLLDQSPLNLWPPSGTVTSPVTVTLTTSIVGGQIRYTTDGSEPTLASPAYTLPLALIVMQAVTVRARVFLNGFPVTDIQSVTYQPDPGIQFTPRGGRFTNSVEVALSSSLGSVDIRYTTDGSPPNLASTPYTAPLTLTNATTLQARAFLNGFPVTEILQAEYQRVYAFDNDGLPADWRRQYFGDDYAVDPRAAAEADPDADGSTNRQEHAAGTHPLDPLSGFRIAVRAIPEITFPSVPGQRYRIVRRASIGDPTGTPIAEVIAESEETRYVDQDAGVVANPAFYLIEPVRP